MAIDFAKFKLIVLFIPLIAIDSLPCYEVKKRGKEKREKIFGEIRNEVLKNKLHEMKVFQIKLYIFARTRRQTKIYTYLYIPHFDWKFVILLKTFLKAQIQVPNLVWSQMSMVC